MTGGGELQRHQMKGSVYGRAARIPLWWGKKKKL